MFIYPVFSTTHTSLFLLADVVGFVTTVGGKAYTVASEAGTKITDSLPTNTQGAGDSAAWVTPSKALPAAAALAVVMFGAFF